MAGTEGGPRRRPAQGGYTRGDETRGRIVDAALQVFGDEGYEGASTRRIADRAGVKPAALQYYFDSKEGLHRACAEHILRHAGGLLQELEGAAPAPADPAEATTAFCDLLDLLVDVSVEGKADPGRARFMARVQADGAGPAMDVIRARLVSPLQERCVALVAAALRGDPADPQVRLRAGLLLSQVSATHSARSSTLSLLGWPDLRGGRIDAVKRALRANTRAALGAS